MYDILIQVASSLITALIIFIITKITKQIKLIPKEKIYNALFKILLIFLYIFMIHNLVVCFKALLNCDTCLKYFICLVGVSYCFYAPVSCSVFIREIFNKNSSK